ncbi:MAG: hypothetical protein ACI9JN_001668, partial [Bacteroidia bacterium]
FKNRMFWGLSTDYTRSLQSIRKVEAPTLVKTQLSLIQTSFVLGVNF